MANGNDIRPDRRQPRILPRPPGQERPRGDDRGPRKGGLRRSLPRRRKRPSTAPSKRAPKPRSCADLFSASRDEIDGIIVTLPNFGDERGIADTLRLADLRRARADPGHARHAGPDDHRRPPRQLLRQDVGLQQPEAVRHPLLADHAAHRGARFRRSSPRTSPGSPPSAAWCAACARCASAPSARAPRPSTPSATARSCWKRSGISVEPIDLSEILGRIDRMKDDDAAVQAKLAGHPHTTSRPTASPPTRS